MKLLKRLGKALLLLSAYPCGLIALLWFTFVLFHIPPGPALHAYKNGALGGGNFNTFYSLSETLVEATPLLLTGLSIVVAWQAGMFSIGGEGQLLMGALTAMSLAWLVHYLPAPLVTLIMVCASIAAGALWGGAAGWLRVKFNVQEVISTIMLNYLALYLVGAAVQGPLQERSRSGPESE